MSLRQALRQACEPQVEKSNGSVAVVLKTVVYLNPLLANQTRPAQQLDQARRFITNPIDPYTRTQTFWRRGRQAIMPPPRAMVRKISSLASWRHTVPARLVTRVPL